MDFVTGFSISMDWKSDTYDLILAIVSRHEFWKLAAISSRNLLAYSEAEDTSEVDGYSRIFSPTWCYIQ